jgi:hypothetical protein
VDSAMADKVAGMVEDSLQLKVEVWPGNRQSAIRVKLNDDLEARAEADGFWQLNFFDGSGVGIGSEPLEIREDTGDAEELASVIETKIKEGWQEHDPCRLTVPRSRLRDGSGRRPAHLPAAAGW